jgi:predicted nucleic acid-binding protein
MSAERGERLAADACLLINLQATRREIDIVQALDVVLVTTPSARRQAGFLHDRDEEGALVSVPIDWGPLEAARRLESDSPGEEDASILVRLSEVLDDPDASVAALAAARGWRLGTDDRKVRRVVGELVPGVALVGTLGLVRAAASVLEWHEGVLRGVIRDLRDRASFLPPRGDPDSTWAEALRG